MALRFWEGHLIYSRIGKKANLKIGDSLGKTIQYIPI